MRGPMQDLSAVFTQPCYDRDRTQTCSIALTAGARGGQTTARGPHAAREGILCGPQDSHTYIDGTYLESMLK